jgi:aryl-alcohol dehydrogenase-like predicted oxidoreductase
MLQKQNLAGTDLNVSNLCMGLGGIGSAIRGDAAQALMDRFMAAGGNFFDTAHCYAFWVDGCLGASERELGTLIRRVGRKNVVISSKGGHPDGGPQYRRPDRYLDPKVVARDLDESLDRLGVSTIDIYHLHRDDRRVPVDEIIDMLDAEAQRGRIRYPAASNWSAARIAEANAYAARAGRRPFVISQPQWSLADRKPNTDPTARFMTPEDRAWHTQSQLPVMPYTPTAGGYFATNGERAKSHDTPISQARLVRVQELAKKIGRTPNQIALAWLMHQPFPVIPITGTVNAEHLDDAIGSTRVRLTPEEVEWLENG